MRLLLGTVAGENTQELWQQVKDLAPTWRCAQASWCAGANASGSSPNKVQAPHEAFEKALDEMYGHMTNAQHKQYSNSSHELALLDDMLWACIIII